jgi:hypothetical protein
MNDRSRRANGTADAPRDFIAVRAPWTLSITPQTGRGWRALFVWIGAILAPHLPLVLWAAAVDGTADEKWVMIALVPLLILNGLTVWAMIRWMLKRADVVTAEDIKRARNNDRPGSNRQGR